MSATEQDDNVPQEVTDLVASIMDNLRVVKGPSGIALLGKRMHGSWVWADARRVEDAVFGDIYLKITGPHKNAVISRLRRLATEEAQLIAMHPASHTGRTERMHGQRKHWQHVAADGATVTDLGGPQAVLDVVMHGYKAPRWSLTQLGLWPGSGAAVKVHGTLVDAHLAYANVTGDPLRLVVPCGHGAHRDVIAVLERENGFDVLGLRLERPMAASSEPQYQQIGSAFSRSYYPLWADLANKKKLRVLKVPD